MNAKKTRLTITLSEEILSQVDASIDKQTIRNRSHAIEHLLTKSLQPSVSTALILAGGTKDEQSEVIRPLTIVNEKPLIHHTLEHLAKFGVQHVIIATNPRGQAIKEVVGDGSQWGLQVEYMIEQKPLGTAGAVATVAKQLDDAFIVWAGDVLTDINLDDMVAFHRQNNALATLAAKPRSTQKSYDNIFIQGHTVVGFEPSQDDQFVSIVNASVYVFEPEIAEAIPEERPSMLERDVFPQLTAAKQCVAFVFQGMWFDVAADPNYQQAFTGAKE